MQFCKIFKILNQIIKAYSTSPITEKTLDSFLTIQIITQCLVDASQVGLTKGELAMLRKISKGTQNAEQQNQKKVKQMNTQVSTKQVQKEQRPQINMVNTTQKKGRGNSQNPINELSSCTVFLIYQIGYDNSINSCPNLSQNLMRRIDNIIIIDSSAGCYNNLLYHEFSTSSENIIKPILELINKQQTKMRTKLKVRPLIIVSLNEHRKWKRNEDKQTYQKKYRYLEQQMQKYLSICQIFQAHLNLRVNMYNEAKCEQLCHKNTIQKLVYFMQTILQFRESDDDYDVLLREEIPNTAYMKVVTHCGNRANYSYIQSAKHFYKIVNNDSKLYYSFRVYNQRQRTTQVIDQQPSDQVLIWVLFNGLPILQLLPLQQQINKKRKSGKKNDKYKEKRSMLGYTRFEMEQKLCPHQSTLQPKKISNPLPGRYQTEQNNRLNEQKEKEVDSLCGQNSNEDDISSFRSELLQDQHDGGQNQRVQRYHSNLSQYIINITDANASSQQIGKIGGLQVKNILKLFSMERRKIYQNLQINRSMKLISRIADILHVEEKDVYHIVYLSKL